MNPRLDPWKAAPGAYQGMAALQAQVNACGLEPSLMELVKLRASQINGCAFCIAMHTRDARAKGETDERMHLLGAWEESPIFTERERAALAFTEALTLITQGHVPDAVYAQARAQFSEGELSNLALAIVAINGWNRMSIAFRRLPDTDAPRL